MFLGKHVLIIQVEQQGGVDNRGTGRSQHSSSDSMMLYKKEAAAVVGIRIRFLLVRGCRSCGIIVGTTAVNAEESAANQLDEAAVGLFVGETKGSQMGVGAGAG